jgi:probable HAF family extracellular repeat protein
VLQSATGINASGQIVGEGTLNGKQHGFLLTLH